MKIKKITSEVSTIKNLGNYENAKVTAQIEAEVGEGEDMHQAWRKIWEETWGQVVTQIQVAEELQKQQQQLNINESF